MISTVLLVVGLVCSCAAVVLEDYRSGRGTFYGNEWWLWDIHQGSCGYGYLCPEEGTGWDIAALPDTHPDYSGSCGQCYEVKCNPTNFQDNYGETLWRQGVCYDPEASIIVTVTDTCPCNYAQNFYSNMRWCCNDMEHLDLSIWAFEKLAETRWGVIGLSYRKVTCDHKPYKEAPEPANPFGPTPVAEGTSCPKGNFPLKENWELIQMMYRKRIENAGMSSFVNTPPLSTNEYYEQLAGRQTQKAVSSEVFSDWFENGWSVFTQNADHSMSDTYGVDQTTSLCSKMWPNGNMQIKGPYGALNGKVSFSMWVRTDGGVPSLDVNVGGSSGLCSSAKLSQLFYSEQKDGYSKYDVFLGTFASSGDDIEQRTIKGMGAFWGCGKLDGSQVDTIVLSNNANAEQSVCVDDIQIME